jgi:hypothetical protein
VSRAFAGPSSNDTIAFSAGTAPPDQGPFTIAGLVKSNAGFGWFASGNNGATPNWAAGLDTGAWFLWNDFTSGRAQIVTTGHWSWIVSTKATGATVPRWHIRDVTSAGSWDHTNTTGGTVADNTGTITNVLVGNFGGAGAANCWQGSIAAIAAWDTTFTDLQVEALATLSAADLLSGGGAATAKWMVRLNQASTATAVQDDTTGGGNQTAISGTTVDASEPPGWSYSLGGGSPPVARQLVRSQAGKRASFY